MSTKRQNNTKERILANAEELILQRGFAGTSIDEILAATGITKGAFFYHFSNKAELAHVLIDRFWQRDCALLERLSQRANELSEDPLQSMLIFLKLFEEYLETLNDASKGCLFSRQEIEVRSQEAEVLKEYLYSQFLNNFKLIENKLFCKLVTILFSPNNREFG
ncbi:MAG: TetR/AcrR family transcriptional regulator [Xenococcaceae cyanobacterium MO_188.B32]|nr:TetR/AcrR family transcriptional regulator [Xenococcaceae cyanobacterium MO_188.B32]